MPPLLSSAYFPTDLSFLSEGSHSSSQARQGRNSADPILGPKLHTLSQIEMTTQLKQELEEQMEQITV